MSDDKYSILPFRSARKRKCKVFLARDIFLEEKRTQQKPQSKQNNFSPFHPSHDTIGYCSTRKRRLTAHTVPVTRSSLTFKPIMTVKGVKCTISKKANLKHHNDMLQSCFMYY